MTAAAPHASGKTKLTASPQHFLHLNSPHTSIRAPHAAALSLAAVATSASAATITLVQDQSYAPYTTKEGKTASGIWADVIAEALTRIEGDFDV